MVVPLLTEKIAQPRKKGAVSCSACSTGTAQEVQGPEARGRAQAATDAHDQGRRSTGGPRSGGAPRRRPRSGQAEAAERRRARPRRSSARAGGGAQEGGGRGRQKKAQEEAEPRRPRRPKEAERKKAPSSRRRRRRRRSRPPRPSWRPRPWRRRRRTAPRSRTCPRGAPTGERGFARLGRQRAAVAHEGPRGDRQGGVFDVVITATSGGMLGIAVDPGRRGDRRRDHDQRPGRPEGTLIQGDIIRAVEGGRARPSRR